MNLRSVVLGALALLTVTATGCAGDAADEETPDQTADALVGGKETLERPEIGRFYHGGSLCTATLVRTNVVLTAAHCFPLADDRDVSKESPAWKFVVTTADGKAQNFWIDRVHSIVTTAELARGGNGWRAQDIALLHLTTDVPASVARPAALASRWTLPGANVTLFGYGCTKRGTGDGVGTKRKLESTWTIGQWLGFSTSDALCPGDSGGPLLDPTANAVMGTNSGNGDATDWFGNVPKNKVAIEAMIARWQAR